jgi:hypothetical protein
VHKYDKIPKISWVFRERFRNVSSIRRIYAARKAYMLATKEQLRDLRGIIYKITNRINGKCYIGQTINSFYDRYGYKWWESRAYKNEHFRRSLKKYGNQSFTVEILIWFKGRLELNIWEELFIKLFRCCDENYGYNINIKSTMGTEFDQKSIEARGRKNRMSKKEFVKRATLTHGNKR